VIFTNDSMEARAPAAVRVSMISPINMKKATIPAVRKSPVAAEARTPNATSSLTLLRDGFHPDSQGGTVLLSEHGEPGVDYPISDYVWQGVKSAYLAMAELQFAAGAKSVLPIHQDAQLYSSWGWAREAIKALPLQKYRATLASAHVMGGCNMSAETTNGVVNLQGRHHQLDNLSVFDGSVLPSSLGANPQLTIYALTLRNTEALIKILQ
jgi:choline dehydrogenase-like flavoprotein